jgi:hypothetical protein
LYCKYALSSGDSETDVLEVSRICRCAGSCEGEHISKMAPNPGESPLVLGQLQVLFFFFFFLKKRKEKGKKKQKEFAR